MKYKPQQAGGTKTEEIEPPEERVIQTMILQKNQTSDAEILILGFEGLGNYRIPLFLLLLLLYTSASAENLLIIFLVSRSPHLHSPMYILISNLLFCEIVYTTDLVPLMLHHILAERAFIYHLGCSVQLTISGCVSIVDALLLTLMSYDRYLAVCQPLRYSALMHNRLCVCLVTVLWAITIMLNIVIFYFVIHLEFCCPLSIDHFYCDFTPLVSLACSDITPLISFALWVSAILTVVPFGLIVVSYTAIIVEILRIRSSTGRQKAFSTCSSHLLVVSIYFGIIIVLYVVPRSSQYLYVYKAMSFMSFAVTPMINPIIYTLRNQDIKKALQTTISEMKAKIHLQ
ncbi:olfactory receptor 10C1-like [Hyperolius riggenbachi]|uniref:olfactory receptor 10C1-like n=1 Tax=Hyperolius riggenbachi TaxID=752182 RepID=UPI0035A28F4E